MSIIMAHRGARNIWAENSLEGFARVIEAGFTAVEFDLHLTGEGTLVVMHDATLERTTNATGLTRNLTDESRKAVRLKDESGTLTEQYVPSFDEVLALFAPHPEITLYVELKSDEANRPYDGMIAKITEALAAHGMGERAWLHSFDIEVVHALRDQAPSFPRMISINGEWAAKQGGLAAFLDRVDDLVAVVGIHHALFAAEAELVKSRLGMDRVSLWTLNDAALMRDMAAHKPKFLVSDDPILLRDTLGEGCGMIRAVLFDCDGVLLDTEPMGCECLAEAVTAAGYPMTRDMAAASFSGSAAVDSLRIMEGMGLNAQAVFADSDARLFQRFERDIPEIAGIHDLLSHCELKVAVCSNSSKHRLALSIERTRLAAFFGPHIYSSGHVALPKPAPDMALFACEALGVAPHEAVFIDDNIHGVACAKAAGCIAVGFVGPSDHREGHAETLRRAGADHVVTSMAAFAALLQTLSPAALKAA